MGGAQLREVEARLLRETKLSADEVAACHNGLERLERAVQRALEQVAHVDVRLKNLADRVDTLGRSLGPDTPVHAELRRELTALRVELADPAAGGGPLVDSGIASAREHDQGSRLELRLASDKAQIDALVEQRLSDTVTRYD